jgi:hypothetical protein
MVHTWLKHGRRLLRRRDREWGKEEEQKRKQQEQDTLMWEQQLEQGRAKREQERRDILLYEGTDAQKLESRSLMKANWHQSWPGFCPGF